MGILASLGATAFKAIGGHLFKGGPGPVESLVAAAGSRLGIGFIMAAYVFNPDFRRGMDICIKAILDAVKGLVF